MKKFLLAIALIAFGTSVSFAQNAPSATTEKTAKTQKAIKAIANKNFFIKKRNFNDFKKDFSSKHC